MLCHPVGCSGGHQTAETARGREWCIRYRITGLQNSVLAISNADWRIPQCCCAVWSGALALPVLWKSRLGFCKSWHWGKPKPAPFGTEEKPMMDTALRTRTAGRWLMVCYCVFAMLFTLAPPSPAQSTYGTLRGTIRDQSQAVVP